MSKEIKVLADVAVTTAAQTVAPAASHKWYIESVIISNITASTNGEITLSFNGNSHFVDYTVAANRVFPVPFPYILNAAENFGYEADANSVFRVALIGVEEDLS